jgi:hypothetical protein
LTNLGRYFQNFQNTGIPVPTDIFCLPRKKKPWYKLVSPRNVFASCMLDSVQCFIPFFSVSICKMFMKCDETECENSTCTLFSMHAKLICRSPRHSVSTPSLISNSQGQAVHMHACTHARLIHSSTKHSSLAFLLHHRVPRPVTGVIMPLSLNARRAEYGHGASGDLDNLFPPCYLPA